MQKEKAALSFVNGDNRRIEIDGSLDLVVTF